MNLLEDLPDLKITPTMEPKLVCQLIKHGLYPHRSDLATVAPRLLHLNTLIKLFNHYKTAVIDVNIFKTFVSTRLYWTLTRALDVDDVIVVYSKELEDAIQSVKCEIPTIACKKFTVQGLDIVEDPKLVVVSAPPQIRPSSFGAPSNSFSMAAPAPVSPPSNPFLDIHRSDGVKLSVMRKLVFAIATQ